MNDLINRQAAIDALIRKMRPHNNGDGTMTICIMTERLVRETLNILPSAQRTGRWIWDDEGYHCSECWYQAYENTAECFDGTFKFCPHCGARMEDGDE